MNLTPRARIIAALSIAAGYAATDRWLDRNGGWDARMIGSLIAFFFTAFALSGRMGPLNRIIYRNSPPPPKAAGAAFEAGCGILAGCTALLCSGSMPIAVVAGGTAAFLAALGNVIEAESDRDAAAIAAERDMASSYAISAIAEEIRSASARGDAQAVEAAAERAQAYADSLIATGGPWPRPDGAAA